MDEAVYAGMAAVQDSHWWYRGRRAVLEAVIARLDLPAGARILEAGCGPGGNLAMLARFGEVSAFEPHAPSRALSAARGCAEVRAGALPHDIPFPGRFDLVCAFDVIEHVADDVATLVALGNRLAEGGRLLVTVPAGPWMWSAHDERHHHYRRYTRRSLAAALRAAGFDKLRLSGLNSHLFPLIAAVRGFQKLTGIDARAEETMPGPAANRLLERIFRAEAPIVARIGYPFGVSLLAVAARGGAT